MEKIGHISFGDIAVNLGYTTAEKVNECLEIQRKIRDMGVVPKKLGEVMIDKGYLTETQVRDIFQKQGLEGGHTQIIGDKIIALIGQGAMGAVYKAVQLSMEREVALKVLSPHLVGNEKFVMRFFKEARAVARLNHPNIIQGIDVGESNGIHYFAMEYVQGKDLEDVIKQQGPMDEKKLAELILQVARALEHAHKNNMVHRDVKPRNIMISNKDNSVKLCDLGLARLVVEGDTSQQKVRMGTPAYISPEQARGEPDIDIRSDIYSLGVTFYFCITGEIPFKGETALIVMSKHINEQLVPPKQKNQLISNMVNTIILKMMSKKRDARYQTPTELIADLEKVLRNGSEAQMATPITVQPVVKPMPAKAVPLVGKISEQTVQRLKARRLARLGYITKRRFKR